MSPRPIPPPRRLLVIPLRFIGDTVVSVPLIRTLRQAFPEARLEAMTSELTRPLLAPCPYLDAVWPEPRGGWAMRQALHGVDTVFLLRKSASMALIAKSAGVRTVVGYDKQRFPAPVGYRRWGLGLDRVARYPSLGTHTPQARSHLGLLHACNLLADDTTLALWDTPDDHAALNALLAQAGVAPEASLAVFHASSASHGKTFAPEVFFPALAALRDAGLAIACVGAAADAPAYEAMAARLGLCEGDGRWANLAGRASLPQTVALCRRSRLALTVDSGPMHLAAAAQTPAIVGVFGPTNERQWGPPPTAQTRFWPVFEPLPCRPCYAKTCAHNACRLTLDPQRILSAVRQALSPDAAMPTG